VVASAARVRSRAKKKAATITPQMTPAVTAISSIG